MIGRHIAVGGQDRRDPIGAGGQQVHGSFQQADRALEIAVRREFLERALGADDALLERRAILVGAEDAGFAPGVGGDPDAAIRIDGDGARGGAEFAVGFAGLLRGLAEPAQDAAGADANDLDAVLRRINDKDRHGLAIRLDCGVANQRPIGLEDKEHLLDVCRHGGRRRSRQRLDARQFLRLPLTKNRHRAALDGDEARASRGSCRRPDRRIVPREHQVRAVLPEIVHPAVFVVLRVELFLQLR